MTHPNQTAWDPAILAKLGTAPYAAMAQDGSADAQIATAMNAETETGPTQLVPIDDVMSYLASNGLWPAIVAASGTNQGAAVAVGIASNIRLHSIDMTLATTLSDLESLVSAGLLSQAQSDALVEMSTTTIPWWQSIGAPSSLNEHDIARAREA